jgi:hypothetical protein
MEMSPEKCGLPSKWDLYERVLLFDSIIRIKVFNEVKESQYVSDILDRIIRFIEENKNENIDEIKKAGKSGAIKTDIVDELEDVAQDIKDKKFRIDAFYNTIYYESHIEQLYKEIASAFKKFLKIIEKTEPKQNYKIIEESLSDPVNDIYDIFFGKNSIVTNITKAEKILDDFLKLFKDHILKTGESLRDTLYKKELEKIGKTLESLKEQEAKSSGSELSQIKMDIEDYKHIIRSIEESYDISIQEANIETAWNFLTNRRHINELKKVLKTFQDLHTLLKDSFVRLNEDVKKILGNIRQNWYVRSCE